MEQYLALRRELHADRAGQGAQKTAERQRAGTQGARAPEGRGQHGADAPQPSAAELREARKTVARVEKSLARLGEREARVHEQMVAQATDPEAMTRLSTELAELHSEREALELEWLEAAEIVG